MSSMIKRAVADALASYISAQVPAFAGAVFPIFADEEELAHFPSVALVPQRLVFNPWQQDELNDTTDDTLVQSFGDFEGELEMRVYAKSAEEREQLGQAIFDLFFIDELRPGILTLSTGSLALPVLGASPPRTFSFSALASFTIEEDAWREEMVFSKKRFDFITLGVVVPQVVARQVEEIDTLTVAIAIERDLTEANPEYVEIAVDENGNITKYP